MNGLLLVDKPEGISSFGVVSKVRWLITQEQRKKHEQRGYCTEQKVQIAKCKCKVKVGHTGTLDPAATGLLVLAIGKYTKKVPELIKQDKTYEVTLKLGEESTTGDKEGEIAQISDIKPNLSQIEAVLQEFTGDLMQTPPAFSAIKINGQRAYNLARKGQEIKIEPRPVKIYSNNLTSYNYPEVKFISSVGSGTYIRSLAEDIGKSLKTGAYMSNLRRTQIDKFSIQVAIQLDSIDYKIIKNHLITLEN
jgi:tRNA pseudouridine55 synthase